ncbi:isomerase [Lentzea sp. NBRC 105346]|uniref:PhzF family phenazine biosynthesis protein n=1 Tax=Lentzea sp. NBRC 105346 TaxID=3032205 RepID=UPI0025574FDA|nr:PhzF family phenazine biosynthesis protein [Lentzea sp. NBRC 105346]GLZ30567.1 isomerase [Lentzea sp. NBRC 105346]
MEIYVVDAFTDRPFRGNPAGVVLLTEPRDAAWMQDIAAEMRHTETAFVDPSVDPHPLRWFTPTIEVDLCGHATLATAHVLGGDRRFTTRSGILTTRQSGDYIEMDFPADPPEPVDELPVLAKALPGMTIKAVAKGVSDYLVEVADANEVRALRPDFQALEQISSRGVIVTARHDGAEDVISRCFYPNSGMPEDPVTGSAHCTLASYWAPRLGTADLLAEQASARGGHVRMTLEDDRVRLAGTAVTVLRGQLSV